MILLRPDLPGTVQFDDGDIPLPFSDAVCGQPGEAITARPGRGSLRQRRYCGFHRSADVRRRAEAAQGTADGHKGDDRAEWVGCRAQVADLQDRSGEVALAAGQHHAGFCPNAGA